MGTWHEILWSEYSVHCELSRKGEEGEEDAGRNQGGEEKMMPALLAAFQFLGAVLQGVRDEAPSLDFPSSCQYMFLFC